MALNSLSIAAYENIDHLLRDVTELEASLTSLIRKIHVIMRFMLMQDEVDCPALKDLRYRKDIVFSQVVRIWIVCIKGKARNSLKQRKMTKSALIFCELCSQALL